MVNFWALCRVSCCMRCLLCFAVFWCQSGHRQNYFLYRMGDNYYFVAFHSSDRWRRLNMLLFVFQFKWIVIVSIQQPNEQRKSHTRFRLQFIEMKFFEFKLLRVSNCCHIINNNHIADAWSQKRNFIVWLNTY